MTGVLWFVSFRSGAAAATGGWRMLILAITTVVTVGAVVIVGFRRSRVVSRGHCSTSKLSINSCGKNTITLVTAKFRTKGTNKKEHKKQFFGSLAL